MKIILSIQRFSPNRDAVPRWEEYEIEAESHESIFELLLRVRRADPSVSFRGSCRSAICGGCAIMVNGRPRLACHALVHEVVGTNDPGPQTIQLAPLPFFRQLKDLVVDIDPFLETLQRSMSWLVPKPGHDGTMEQGASSRIESAATCVLCGICDGIAEDGINRGDDAGWAAPVALVKAFRFAGDPRDSLGIIRLKYLNDLGLVPPEFAERLQEVCPKGIRLDVEMLERVQSHNDLSW